MCPVSWPWSVLFLLVTHVLIWDLKLTKVHFVGVVRPDGRHLLPTEVDIHGCTFEAFINISEVVFDIFTF